VKVATIEEILSIAKTWCVVLVEVTSIIDSMTRHEELDSSVPLFASFNVSSIIKQMSLTL
jgi:hypothetical protein